jgi:hypothetical protein
MKSLKNIKQNSTLSHDLKKYGLSLSENNIFTFTPKKSFSFTTKNKNKALNENIKIEINEEMTIPHKNNLNKEYQNIINNNKLNLKHIHSKNNLLPINKFLIEKGAFPQNSVNIREIKNILNIPKPKNIQKEEEKKIKIYIDDLMENKFNNKKIYKKKSFKCLFNTPKQSAINPLKYIEFNLSENPHKPSVFKSYKLQVKLMGNEKYRNLLLDDINYYNNNYSKFKNIKTNKLYDDKNENKEEINKNIKEMLKDKIKSKNKSLFLFKKSIHNSKKKKKLFRNFYSFSFDSNYKLSENKRIDNFNSRFNLVSKNDIDKINKYIETNRKKLSFDEKINLLLLRAKKTSNFIKKRTEEYDRINKIIFKSIG